MFNKFSFDLSREKIKRQFNLPLKQELIKSYHVSPENQTYVLTSDSGELSRFKWGLIPHWAKDPDSVKHLVNAMAEGIESKDSFRMAIRQRRCIVFADSYYDSIRKNQKEAYYRILLRNQAVMAFAGIWDLWTDENGREYYSFALITTEASDAIKVAGFSRMPLIFTEESELNNWLDTEKPLQKVLKLLKPFESTELFYYPVSDALDNPANNYPELHKEIIMEDDL